MNAMLKMETSTVSRFSKVSVEPEFRLKKAQDICDHLNPLAPLRLLNSFTWFM